MNRELVVFAQRLGHSEVIFRGDSSMWQWANEPAILQLQRRATKTRQSMGFEARMSSSVAYDHAPWECLFFPSIASWLLPGRSTRYCMTWINCHYWALIQKPQRRIKDPTVKGEWIWWIERWLCLHRDWVIQRWFSEVILRCDNEPMSQQFYSCNVGQQRHVRAWDSRQGCQVQLHMTMRHGNAFFFRPSPLGFCQVDPHAIAWNELTVTIEPWYKSRNGTSMDSTVRRLAWGQAVLSWGSHSAENKETPQKPEKTTSKTTKKNTKSKRHCERCQLSGEKVMAYASQWIGSMAWNIIPEVQQRNTSPYFQTCDGTNKTLSGNQGSPPARSPEITQGKPHRHNESHVRNLFSLANHKTVGKDQVYRPLFIYTIVYLNIKYYKRSSKKK